MIKSSTQQTYYNQVWDFVRKVPSGKVVTYGQIAQALPDPPEQDYDDQSVSVARLVGNAMAASPADVPWHRVINAQGRVSSRADASRQVKLLVAEGLTFHHGRIDLHEYLWHGSEHEQPKQQHLF